MKEEHDTFSVDSRDVSFVFLPCSHQHQRVLHSPEGTLPCSPRRTNILDIALPLDRVLLLSIILGVASAPDLLSYFTTVRTIETRNLNTKSPRNTEPTILTIRRNKTRHVLHLSSRRAIGHNRVCPLMDSHLPLLDPDRLYRRRLARIPPSQHITAPTQRHRALTQKCLSSRHRSAPTSALTRPRPKPRLWDLPSYSSAFVPEYGRWRSDSCARPAVRVQRYGGRCSAAGTV